jgi:hypothetical protein
MNENAKKLVHALRSGKYEQTTGLLKDETGFCCLGVACDLYAQEFPDEAYWHGDDSAIFFDGEDQQSTNLTEAVKEWLGFKDTSGRYDVDPEWLENLKKNTESPIGHNWFLTNDNDVAKRSFNEIADIIESEPEGLFVN